MHDLAHLIQPYLDNKFMKLQWFENFRPVNVRGLDDVSFAEAEFGDRNENSSDEGEDESASEDVTVPGLQRILSTDDQDVLTEDEAFLVYLGPLINLRCTLVPLSKFRCIWYSGPVDRQGLGPALFE